MAFAAVTRESEDRLNRHDGLPVPSPDEPIIRIRYRVEFTECEMQAFSGGCLAEELPLRLQPVIQIVAVNSSTTQEGLVGAPLKLLLLKYSSLIQQLFENVNRTVGLVDLL